MLAIMRHCHAILVIWTHSLILLLSAISLSLISHSFSVVGKSIDAPSLSPFGFLDPLPFFRLGHKGLKNQRPLKFLLSPFGQFNLSVVLSLSPLSTHSSLLPPFSSHLSELSLRPLLIAAVKNLGHFEWQLSGIGPAAAAAVDRGGGLSYQGDFFLIRHSVGRYSPSHQSPLRIGRRREIG